MSEENVYIGGTSIQIGQHGFINQPKEIIEYIKYLQKENEFLKLSNPEMNLEHWKVVNENKRKIDNLRKHNKQLKNQLQQKDTRNSRQRIANRKLLERNQDLVIENLKLNNNKDNAINFIDQVLMYHLQDYKQLDEDINTLIGILKENDEK